MRRFAINGYGKAEEVFEEILAQPREVTAEHVRINLKAFSINPYDVAVRLGKMKAERTLKFPYVLGNDGAGIITEVGEGVNYFHVGDRVALHALGGTYGEEVVVPVKKIAKLPEKMNWAEASAIVTPGITAYHLITHLLDIQPTDTVMILGASGNVGRSLVQLLHEKGIHLLASASKRNEHSVRQLGVSHFSAYDEENPGEVFADQADIVIDATKGSRQGKVGIQIMKEGGRYIALNDLPELSLRNEKNGFYEMYIPRKEYQDREAFDHLFSAYQQGHFAIKIAETLPATLANVIVAHQKMEGHPPAGKISLVFD
ncbi:hypothetical protein A5844_001129 [Enterococcus sp. 10A9_DIV0425]|uniref:Enoyl reductase (ER) domain-containing protein n=1 Tax=Candidatus Enterococcus wittei TaxID=1987383 RepID=A0A242K089_9ENTE|nr:NADP-dependent oxidoreductase [Enterococcus sp. 10A9_DIV0425]OTP10995.1 hypothetical protein A5844_001129 [Enterococcus sp. 10A9_DIV0425]THE16240.1 NADP-dependent oxidoreductase [Enterococcus hirae]